MLTQALPNAHMQMNGEEIRIQFGRSISTSTDDDTSTNIPFSIDGAAGERLKAIQGSVGEGGETATTSLKVLPSPLS